MIDFRPLVYSILTTCIACLPLLWAAPTDAAQETSPADDDGFIIFESGSERESESESSPADDEQQTEEEGELSDDIGAETLVSGSRGARKRIAGSASVINEKELEAMEYDDIQRSLKQKVPGVYVREEDGFGLRPNIGLRGANSDRSAKITLLEDNVLFAPAPYAAPAAYYFPLTTRMVGIEVFKGPAAIRTGPITVGGAINLRTRRIPWSGVRGGFDVAAGLYESGKGHAHIGAGNDYFGILLEGVHLRSGGFKRIDGSSGNGLWGNDSGFVRNDVMLKARANTDPMRPWMHHLELKLGFASESSNETYLGLSDVDFQNDPFRRYLASSRGHMEWNRSQAQVRYRFTWGDDVDASVTIYRHDLQRSWEKFNRFRDGPDVRRVLQNPSVGANAIFYQLLTGERDSVDDNDALLVGTNDRRYFSQGIQLRTRVGFDLGPVRQDVELGLRLHQDQIVRNHTEQGFLVVDRKLSRDSRETAVTAENAGTAIAASGYLVDEVAVGPLLLTPGLRVEVVRSVFENYLVDTALSDVTRVAFIPGIGAYVQALSMLGFYGGVHKGFAPVSPGQPEEVLVEESWNYELGTRFQWQRSKAEVTGYLNHYTNLVGACTFSAGCADDDINAQFNAGQALIGGVEVVAKQELPLPLDVNLSVEGVYTLTIARFLSDFSSGFPQWGEVKAGDELPYVPTHQASLTLGATRRAFTWTVNFGYVGSMRDIAGQGDVVASLVTDPSFLIDTMASYEIYNDGDEGGSVYFRVDNVLNTKVVSSLRPYGARPGKPLLVMVGYKHKF